MSVGWLFTPKGRFSMTQIGGFIAPTKRPGEVGVHSLNHFSLQVPDMAVAEDFYKSFGLNLSAKGNQLSLRTYGSAHEWAVLTEGPHKQLQYISFGAFEEDFEGLRERLQRLGVTRLDPPPGFDSAGVWFRDPDGTLVEIKVSEKTSPHQKSSFAMPSVPGGCRGVSGRGAATQVRPRRLSHVLMFTKDVDRAVHFYHQVVGLRLSDRSGDGIAFMHGIHGSDHHLLAFGKSSGGGFHHCSWDVGSTNEVGQGAMQMADKGFKAGWGLGRHVLGSNYFHYVRDPWGSYCEYSSDIDYIPCGCDWDAGDNPPEDAIYLWGPEMPQDFTVNYELVETRTPVSV
jgi:catechol 2,3-dioxygenase-like lactoylglutathione lyase family enzyme